MGMVGEGQKRQGKITRQRTEYEGSSHWLDKGNSKAILMVKMGLPSKVYILKLNTVIAG